MEVFKAGYFQKIPHSFLYVDIGGVTRLVGPYAQTVKYFAKFQHYNFDYSALATHKISDAQRDIEKGLYNISMQAAAYQNAFANVSFSYPIKWSQVCIMVPAEHELSRFWYVVWPFDLYIWIIVWILLIYVAFLMHLLRHPSPKFTSNLLSSLAVILNSPNMNLRVVNVAHKLKLFYGLLLLIGFILSSYYGSYLTVYNMKPLFQASSRTIEDLLRSNRPIWIPTQLLEEMRNNPNVNLKRLDRLIVEKPQREVTNKIHDLSRSYAYGVSQSDWTFLSKLQRYLIQPTFRLTDICPIASLSSYAINMNAKFASDLNLFILFVHQAGLWKYWEEQAFMAAVQAKFFKILLDSYPVEPLNLFYFRIAWIIYGLGNTLAILCVIFEVMQNKRCICLNK